MKIYKKIITSSTVLLFLLIQFVGFLPHAFADEDSQTTPAPFDKSCSAARLIKPYLDIDFPDTPTGKVFPGQSIPYEIWLPEDTEYKEGAVLGTKRDGSPADPITGDQVIYEYGIYIWDSVRNPDPALGGAYVPIPNSTAGIIRPDERKVGEFTIPAGTRAGEYDLRFSFIDKIRPCVITDTNEYDTRITVAGSQGVIITLSDTDIKKGDTADISVKFFGLQGQTYKVFIDDEGGKKDEGLVPADNVPVVVHWNTGGTSEASHKIFVKVYPGVGGTNNNYTEKMVTVSATGGSGSSGSGGTGFSITKLNTYTLQNLLGSTCNRSPAPEDLMKVLCIVETVIFWLLDIAVVIAVIMILYASIVYLTSYGEESKAELAKKTLIWSVIGVIVVAVAIGVMKIVEDIFNATTN